MIRSEAWFQRQEDHLYECMVELNKVHTEQEIADAWAALSVAPVQRQSVLRLVVGERPRQ